MLSLKKTEAELHDGWLTLWLNRPESRNAIDPVIMNEITRVMRWLRKKDEYVAVVIRGRGKSFCAGADINWMKQSATPGLKQSYSESKRMAAFFKKIYKSEKIIINLIHGHAFGGAMGFLGTGDFSFTLKDTLFALPEVKLGLFPAVIMPYLLLRSKTSDLYQKLFTGSVFTPDEALKMGLVNGVYENMKEMESAASALISDLKSVSPGALAEGKKLLRTLHKNLINRKNIKRTIVTLSGLKLSEDAQNRMAAFTKRPGN